MNKNMNNCKLEYLWLDGYKTPNVRSKTKYCKVNPYYDDGRLTLKDVPEWGFDGSSTKQAVGSDSDCVLKPVSIYNNTVDSIIGNNSYIILCEVMNSDGTPHKSNTRAKLRKLEKEFNNQNFLFGIEQEYTVIDNANNKPYGWPENGYPSPQGRYYCGVGGDVVAMRDLIHEHAMACNTAGIPLCGTNAEVMLGQWEYQIGTAGILEICDYLWVARYMLEVLAETKNVSISLDPKPVTGDWNGSGAHINFSTERLREEGGKGYITGIIKNLMDKHEEHIEEYGIGNEDRLTGEHETQHIDVFSSGDSDRGASIRIPPITSKTLKGYLEDRRPSANMDPYRAVAKLVKTVGSVSKVVNSL